MKTIQNIFISIICALTVNVSAQEKSFQFDIAPGISNSHIIERLSNPMIFRGTGISPLIRIQRYGSRSRQFVNGKVAYANLKNGVDNYKAENFRTSLNIGSEFAVLGQKDGSNQNYLMLGGSISSFYCKTCFFFKLPSIWATALKTWYWRHSLDFTASGKIKLSDKQNIIFRMGVPVVCNISRPTFSSSGDFDVQLNTREIKTFGNTVFIGENFSIETSVAYYRPISQNLELFAEYEFSFNSYKNPDKIAMYMNNLNIGITFKLKK